MEIKAGSDIILETCDYCRSTNINITRERSSLSLDTMKVISCNECGEIYYSDYKSLY